jgi:hypothetical protein
MGSMGGAASVREVLLSVASLPSGLVFAKARLEFYRPNPISVATKDDIDLWKHHKRSQMHIYMYIHVSHRPSIVITGSKSLLRVTTQVKISSLYTIAMEKDVQLLHLSLCTDS